MKNINDKKILNITALCILIIVPFLKFFSMNLEMFGLIRNYDNINPAIVLYVSVPFLLFIYIKQLIKSKRRLDKFDYIFFALVFAALISTIFSIDKNLAIYGKEFRHEGLLSILSYYLLFINYKVYGTREDVNKFIKLFIIIGIINSIYALLQIYTDFNFILRYYDDRFMASGMCGNPNFFGSLIVTCLALVICKILVSKKINIKMIFTLILLFISLINSQSTGPFLTLILAFIFLIVFIHLKKQLVLKNIFIIVFLLIITNVSINLINRSIYKIDRCEICAGEIKETINNGGNGRLEIWKNSLEIVNKNIIYGVGFDNFYLAYPNPEIPNGISVALNTNVVDEDEYYLLTDNAHNVYLHHLVSNGVLGIVPYMFLLILVFIKGLKSKNKELFILFAGFIAYSMQAFANISVVQVAPIYYIIIGLILSMK